MTDPRAADGRQPAARVWPWAVVILATLLGLGLIADQAWHLSATYDEVTYLEVAARWWRTGEQERITRMGSPLTFWKLQQVSTLFLLDRCGARSWVDDPIAHQAQLLPWIRLGGAWIWLAAFGVTVGWARSWHGDRGMALAAALFALSPNLIAHGTLATMELPVVAASAAMLFAFVRYLETGGRGWFWGSAGLAGLAFSCKYTTVILPPILAVIWAVDRFLRDHPGEPAARRILATLRVVVPGMVGFLAAMLLTNLIVTGFATVRLSARVGPHPILAERHPLVARAVGAALERSFPADWVGFATQVIFQRNGGPSYLLGRRSCSGWWYYYPVSLAVKVPLAVGFLALARWRLRGSIPAVRGGRGWVVPAFVGLFLLAAIVGSKRNYGVRYLLPLAPASIVGLAGLANAGPGRRWVAPVGVAGMALAVASIHPYELAYFNVLAGGAEGGRRVLSDSNLDWGQGAIAVARLQAEHPEFRDLTWYAFGDTDPGHYGVVGTIYRFDAHRPPADLPPELGASTRWVAVSASLQWGPWGPPGYFRALDGLTPARYSSDKTVAFYRAADVAAPGMVRTGPGRE